jgi:RNA polymerase sigma-70 factor, ECF subfamily
MRDVPPSLSWVELNGLGDTELLVRLLAGDHTALAVLFDRYHRLVFSVAVRILRDEGEAEDVVQTVFLNLFQSAANFNPEKGTLKVWLLQYAYHRSINRRRSLLAQGVYLWEQLDAGNDAMAAPDLESLRMCEQMLARLKPQQRQVLEMTYFEGWTAREIAALQDRPAEHVRHDLYRGLAKLRASLGREKKPMRRAEAEMVERRTQIADTRSL